MPSAGPVMSEMPTPTLYRPASGSGYAATDAATTIDAVSATSDSSARGAITVAWSLDAMSTFY